MLRPPSLSGGSELEMVELLFALSRRTEQAFSVVSIQIGSNGNGCPDLGQLEPAIAAALRRTDLLVRWDGAGDPGHYAVFCPATNAEGAKELIRRIWALAAPHPVRGGTATFPLDGLVLDDLIDLARDAHSGPNEQAARLEKSGGALIRLPVTSRLDRTRERRSAAFAKRAFDLFFTAATAPVWLPALALVALAIKCSAPRAPVIFAQPRTGRGGHRFRMYKFRTMVPDAEELKKTYAHLNQLSWPDFKIEADPRITRIGGFLRKTSLDELPQVWNVVRGEMSWVGPRPTSFGPETYAIWQTARLDVVPGITGLWQVVGRGRTEFDERLRLDMEYIDRRSLKYDLGILFLTVREIFRPRGGF